MKTLKKPFAILLLAFAMLTPFQSVLAGVTCRTYTVGWNFIVTIETEVEVCHGCAAWGNCGVWIDGEKVQ